MEGTMEGGGRKGERGWEREVGRVRGREREGGRVTE